MQRIIRLIVLCATGLTCGPRAPAFRVVAFSTAKEDPAHISFVREARVWFPEMATQYHFAFDTTSDWRNLNDSFLARYDVVIFLDTRPEDLGQRAAFSAIWAADRRRAARRRPHAPGHGPSAADVCLRTE